MKRYSFIYSDKSKRISELIEYLEEKYNLTFLAIVDLNPNFSFTPYLFSVTSFKKEVMFESNPKFEKISNRFCSKCNFPIFSEEDLEPFKVDEEKIKTCKGCGSIVWEDGEFLVNMVNNKSPST